MTKSNERSKVVFTLQKKAPVKKKIKKKHRKSRKSGVGLPDDDEEFEYSWPKCICGMDHPPVPTFNPPDGKRCTYYWASMTFTQFSKRNVSLLKFYAISSCKVYFIMRVKRLNGKNI